MKERKLLCPCTQCAPRHLKQFTRTILNHRARDLEQTRHDVREITRAQAARSFSPQIPPSLPRPQSPCNTSQAFSDYPISTVDLPSPDCSASPPVIEDGQSRLENYRDDSSGVYSGDVSDLYQDDSSEPPPQDGLGHFPARRSMTIPQPSPAL